MTLLEHRQNLKNNERMYIEDIERCYSTVVNHLKNAGYKKITYNRASNEIKEFVNLIFDAQHKKPFLHIESEIGLPFCWNSPYKDGWSYNYIRYEWGHLNSRNQNKETAHDIENLCLQSARCNQHIQSSMNITELKEYGGKLEKVIDENLKRREDLFKTQHWKELLKKMEEWR